MSGRNNKSLDSWDTSTISEYLEICTCSFQTAIPQWYFHVSFTMVNDLSNDAPSSRWVCFGRFTAEFFGCLWSVPWENRIRKVENWGISNLVIQSDGLIYIRICNFWCGKWQWGWFFVEDDFSNGLVQPPRRQLWWSQCSDLIRSLKVINSIEYCIVMGLYG